MDRKALLDPLIQTLRHSLCAGVGNRAVNITDEFPWLSRKARHEQIIMIILV